MNRPTLPVSSCEVSWGPADGTVALLDGAASLGHDSFVHPSAGRRYLIAGTPPRARRMRFHRQVPAPTTSTSPIADAAAIWLAEVSSTTEADAAGDRSAAEQADGPQAGQSDVPVEAISAGAEETVAPGAAEADTASAPPVAADADAASAPPEEASAPPKEKGLLHYLGTAISAALLILVLGIAALVIAIPAVVGGQALTVLTQSMEPGLPPGTLIVIKPTPAADIRIGDVVTYQIASDQPAVVSHRVVTKSIGTDGETTFTTKGDNNDLVDENPVREVQVRGTLWYSIPYLGWVNNAVNGDARTFIIPIAAGGLFLYAVYMFGGSVRERVRKRRALAA